MIKKIILVSAALVFCDCAAKRAYVSESDEIRRFKSECITLYGGIFEYSKLKYLDGDTKFLLQCRMPLMTTSVCDVEDISYHLDCSDPLNPKIKKE